LNNDLFAALHESPCWHDSVFLAALANVRSSTVKLTLCRERLITEANDVECILTDINADYCNRSRCCRGVLLVWAPLASLSLAGQEHGLTTPLADQQKPRAGHTTRTKNFGEASLPIRPVTYEIHIGPAASPPKLGNC
jgi:hypothetical protein